MATALGLQTTKQQNTVRNLYNSATLQVGLVHADGSYNLDGYGGAYSFATVDVSGCSTIIANVHVPHFGDGSSGCFYDALDNPVSSPNPSADISQNTPITVPSGATTFRWGMQTGEWNSGVMVVPGSTLPNQYIAFGSVDSATLSRSIATVPSAATLGAVFDAMNSPVRQVFDSTRLVSDQAINGSGFTSGVTNYQTSDFCYVGDATQIIADFPFQSNGLGGALACFDINKAFIGNASVSYPTTPKVAINLLSNTAYIRFTEAGVSPSTWAVRHVYTGGTYPLSDQSFLNWTNIAAADAVVARDNRPFTGMRALFVGDSITAGGEWASIFASYHSLSFTGGNYPAFNDLGAWSSSASYGVFDLVYSGSNYWLASTANTNQTPQDGSAYWTRAETQGDILGNPGHPTSDAYLQYANNLANHAAGPTIVQQLTSALTNKDLMFIFHGTNDPGTPLGSLGDQPYTPTSTGGGTFAGSTSLYGSIEYAVQTALNAISGTGRDIRLFYVTPYHQSHITSQTSTTLAQCIQAIKDVCNEYGVPVIDNTATLGINRFNWCTAPVTESTTSVPNGNSAWYLADTLHPSNPLGYTRLAMNIARQAARYAHQR